MALCLAVTSFAAEKKDEKKPEPPRVLVALPLAVEAGTNTTIRLRGLSLAETKAIRFVSTNAAAAAASTNAALSATLKTKGKAEVPKDYDVKRVGDTQLEVELKLPASLAAGPLALVVITPEGETAPYLLTIAPAGSLVAEKEPNGGFRQAQELSFGKTVRGTISEPNDVDVFRFAGQKDERIVATVTAARMGSSLDGILTLYNNAGQILATSDDSEAGPDPLLNARLPADGTYFLGLIDAHDRGSPMHVYLLSLNRTKPEKR
ncbi:hypothetical protein LBMAG56_08310 [Verrucomicrobiota bacterium]|nr:hypothetical protein LBMAG56_08310 [Verrucomicrobiota bacterium]